jgi:aspartyl-tRNA synthetase
MEITDVTSLVEGCDFKVFADMAEKEDCVVHAMRVEGGEKFTRKEIDELTNIAFKNEAKGLAYIIVKEDKLQSPIVKFLGEELSQKIVENLKAKAGDIIFFGADRWRVVCNALGAVRNECGNKLGLKDNKKISWCWIVDFPMYDYSEIEDGRIDFGHNPFSHVVG